MAKLAKLAGTHCIQHVERSQVWIVGENRSWCQVEDPPVGVNKEGTYNLDGSGDLQCLRRLRQSGPGRHHEQGPCRSQALAVTVWPMSEYWDIHAVRTRPQLLLPTVAMYSDST